LRILQNFVQFKLVANTVITEDNIEECFDILDFCCDLGICFSPVSANIKHKPNYTLLKTPRYLALVDKILERADQGYPMIASSRMLKQLLHAENIQCYPTVFDHVDYTGEIFWPCKTYSDAAMINVLDYKNLHEVHKAAEKLIDPTNFQALCGGECAWMQDMVTDSYGKALMGLFESGVLKEIIGLI
jgi:MoaA/NifB/PqqE/SkfB family radical SAM enzyme